MIRAFGSATRMPGSPAASRKLPIEAAWPTHTVRTLGLMYCMVSWIAIPAVTTPPGELMYIEMSWLFSLSRNSSWATISEAMWSSTSPGGVVTAGMAIHDTMQYIKPKVRTVCVGQAASMGSFLLAAGEPGMRVALPNARIMVHQPSGGARGMASDIEIQAKEILRIRTRMNDLYARYTGQTLTDIEKALDRDTFLEAEEALKFGIVDKVFAHRPKDEETGEASGSGGAPE